MPNEGAEIMLAYPTAALLIILAPAVSSAHTEQQPSPSTTTQQVPDAPTPHPSSSYRPNPDENGIYRIGNGVTAPTLIYSVEPEFSEEARKRKVAASITVEFIVDSDGHSHDFHVTKTDGRPNTSKRELAALQSLEPKAIEAVRQYRFKPATYHGKPVPCRMWVEVNFQIF